MRSLRSPLAVVFVVIFAGTVLLIGQVEPGSVVGLAQATLRLGSAPESPGDDIGIISRFLGAGESCSLDLPDLSPGMTSSRFQEYLIGISRSGAVVVTEGAAAVGDTLRRADQFVWATGRPAPGSRADLDPLDIQAVRVTLGGANITLDYMMSAAPSRYPMFYKVAFDLPVCGGACGRSGIPRASAQGGRNPFDGPGFEEDVVVFARLDGPGRVAIRALVGGAERPIPGSAEVSGSRVRVSLSALALAQLGLAPGVRVVFGVVGPPPEAIYDRVPERGWLQLGIPGTRVFDPRQAVARHDVTGNGKEDLFYLDTNGNQLIDAAALDRNGDGRIVFGDGEGPFQLVAVPSSPAEFASVERRTAGKEHLFLAVSSQVIYMTVAEDKNGDGDIADPGELVGVYIHRP